MTKYEKINDMISDYAEILEMKYDKMIYEEYVSEIIVKLRVGFSPDMIIEDRLLNIFYKSMKVKMINSDLQADFMKIFDDLSNYCVELDAFNASLAFMYYNEMLFEDMIITCY